jgi:hypothetical protein
MRAFFRAPAPAQTQEEEEEESWPMPCMRAGAGERTPARLYFKGQAQSAEKRRNFGCILWKLEGRRERRERGEVWAVGQRHRERMSSVQSMQVLDLLALLVQKYKY